MIRNFLHSFHSRAPFPQCAAHFEGGPTPVKPPAAVWGPRRECQAGPEETDGARPPSTSEHSSVAVRRPTEDLCLVVASQGTIRRRKMYRLFIYVWQHTELVIAIAVTLLIPIHIWQHTELVVVIAVTLFIPIHVWQHTQLVIVIAVTLFIPILVWQHTELVIVIAVTLFIALR